MESVSELFREIRSTLGIRAYEERIAKHMAKPKEVVFGYNGYYKYLRYGGLVLSEGQIVTERDATGAPLKTKPTPVRFSHASDTYITFRTSQNPVYAEDDPLSAAYVMASPLYSPSAGVAEIPVVLLHSDTAPSLEKGSFITAQCTFVAEEFTFAPSGQRKKKSALDTVRRLDLSRRPAASYHPTKVVLEGEVLSLSAVKPRFRSPVSIGIYWVYRVRTIFGVQTVCIDLPNIQKKNIKEHGRIPRERDRIRCTGWLIADIATVQHQEGALWDDVHRLLLLRGALSCHRPEVLEGLLDEKALLLQTSGSPVRGKKAITSFLSDLFRPTRVESVRIAHVDEREAAALDQDAPLALIAFARDKTPLFLLFLTPKNPTTVAHLTLDYRVKHYKWFVNPIGEFHTGEPDADHPMDRQFVNYQGFRDINPMVDHHMENLKDIWHILFASEQAHDKALADFEKNSELIIPTQEDGREGYYMVLAEMEQPRLLSLGYEKPESGRVDLFYLPVFPGTKVRATYRSFYPWLPDTALIGEVTFFEKGWNEPLSAFAGLSYLDVPEILPGVAAEFFVAAVAGEVHKAETSEFCIDKGPLYEICLREFLSENPDKTELDFPELKLQTNGIKMLMPTDCSSIYLFRTSVKKVRTVPFTDSVLFCCEVDLFVGTDSPLNDMLTLNLYLSQTACGDYVPREGDDIEGICMLMVESFERLPSPKPKRK